MLEKILNNKIIYLAIYFLGFIVFWILIFNMIFADKIVLNESYLYLFKGLSVVLGVYILSYIFKDSKDIFDFVSDSRLLFLVALVFLVYTVFYLIIWDEKIAESYSIKAYYFLIWWVLLEILKNIFSEK